MVQHRDSQNRFHWPVRNAIKVIAGLMGSLNPWQKRCDTNPGTRQTAPPATAAAVSINQAAKVLVPVPSLKAGEVNA